MNLPNRLTIIRCIITPIILLFMFPISFLQIPVWNQFIDRYGIWIAFLLFIIASATDFMDGYVARKYGLITNLGKFLDPIADKVLVLSIFIAFVALGQIHPVIPIIILFREFAVTGIRLMALEKGIVIAASNLGKSKTVLQIIAIILLFLSRIMTEVGCDFYYYVHLLASFFLFLCLVMTILSGFDYFRKSVDFFRNEI